jgi:hypothetical protein
MNLAQANASLVVLDQMLDNHKIIVEGSKDKKSISLYMEFLQELKAFIEYVDICESGNGSEDMLLELHNRCEKAHLVLKDSERSFIEKCAKRLGKTKDKIWTK